MYDAVRAVSPDALVVMGGTGWSYDAVGPLAIWQQYKKEHNGTALRNVVYNLHGAFDAQRCVRPLRPQALTPNPTRAPRP
jgi:hypothetical protein